MADGLLQRYVDDAAGRHNCGAPRRPCSPYCAEHHAICYVVIGSRRETGLLRRFEYLAHKGGKGRRNPLGRIPLSGA